MEENMENLPLEPIKWKSGFCKVRDLKDYSNNPRKMGKDEFNNLVRSLVEDGYHQRLLVNTDGTIIGGHSRKKALLKAGYTLDSEIEVLFPTVQLSGEAFDRVNIRDNLGYGAWDFDMLGNNFEPQQLIDWGMPPVMLGRSHYSLDEEESDSKIKEHKTKTCPACGEILN